MPGVKHHSGSVSRHLLWYRICDRARWVNGDAGPRFAAFAAVTTSGVLERLSTRFRVSLWGF